MSKTLHLTLRRQRLIRDDHGHNVWETVLEERDVPATQTALLLCDIWDKHWSRGACERLDAMIPRMNALVRALREAGSLIIHAPSDTMDYYATSPARQRIRELPRIDPPPPLEHEDPPLPIDAGDHGSDTGELAPYKAWQHQHPGIEIDEARDVISDDGREIYAYLRSKEVLQTLIMGVHTNMCILNRSFGIKQIVRWGVPIALVRDLTDTMYNPAMLPYVSHEEGTELVIGYIEKFWCPTVWSRDLF